MSVCALPDSQTRCLPATVAVVLLLSGLGCTARRPSAAPPVVVSPAPQVSASAPAPTAGGPATGAAPSRAGAEPLTPGAWVSCFDGTTLAGWRILEDGAFTPHGEVRVEDGRIVMKPGMPFTGIVWAGDFPRDNYEVEVEANRLWGYDIFCGLTFAVADSALSLVLGGWGDTVVGLSCINGNNASTNETTRNLSFNNNEWVRVRVRVTTARIEAWVNDAQVVNLERAGRKFSVYDDLEINRPFGFFTWSTEGALRNVRVRRLSPGP